MSTNSSDISSVDLLGKGNTWLASGAGRTSITDGVLQIYVETNSHETLFNRAYLHTRLNIDAKRPLLLTMNYSTDSLAGNASFYTEIRSIPTSENLTNNNSSPSMILWSSPLEDTGGVIKKVQFILPPTIVQKEIELRFYAITKNPGIHTITIGNATITHIGTSYWDRNL